MATPHTLGSSPWKIWNWRLVGSPVMRPPMACVGPRNAMMLSMVRLPSAARAGPRTSAGGS